MGGNVLTSLDAGVVIHNREIPGLTIPVAGATQAFCPDDAIDLAPGFSMARQWNEQLLNAIRRDTPRPTVHARNLFHTSAAMWDAWVAYQDKASAFLVSESHTADDVGRLVPKQSHMLPIGS